MIIGKASGKAEYTNPEKLINDFIQLVNDFENKKLSDKDFFIQRCNEMVNSYLYFKGKSDKFNRTKNPLNQDTPQKQDFESWARFNIELIKEEYQKDIRGWRGKLYKSATKTMDFTEPTFYRHLKKFIQNNF
jgi:hypothetical protein